NVAKKAGAMSMLVAIAQNPDNQLASTAVKALGRSGTQLDLAVPALVECLQSTNDLIGCEAVWALEWCGKEFDAYSNTIIPALGIAAKRQDSVGKYAKVALMKWTARPGSKQGAT